MHPHHVTSTKQKVFVVAFIFISLHCSSVYCEEFGQPKPSAPFHNLIPRFKMPRGHLLRYEIPQWEVLYFLKYGIVPFIFYDPDFNRTNFVSQVRKFKMYFEDGRSNRTYQPDIKDEDSFKEFLRKHEYPNYNQIPEDALNQNIKVAKEIHGLLQEDSNSIENTTNFGSQGRKDTTLQPMTPLDILLESLKGVPYSLRTVEGFPKNRMKRSILSDDPKINEAIRQYFWNTFINRYPFTWKYRQALILGKQRDVLLKHSPPWMRTAFPFTKQLTGNYGMRRHIKSNRIGLRNVDGGIIDDEKVGGGDPDDAKGERRTSKTFQTQGWR